MDLKTRPMQAGDAAAARQILNDIIGIGGTTALETEVDAVAFARMYLDGPDLIACHVAIDSAGQVVGFQWVGRNPTLPADCADIATFTRREPPQRGAGRALFAATCESTRAAGYAQINATIRADNVPGLGYYSKMGFVDHAVTRNVALKNGHLVDRISKRYQL